MPTITHSSPVSSTQSSSIFTSISSSKPHRSKSTTSVTSSTSTSISVPVSSPSPVEPAACDNGVLNGNAMVPASNPNIARLALANLIPSNNITLMYAQPGGNRAASLDFTMIYPTVVLEYSSFITSYSCDAGVLSMAIQQSSGAMKAINAIASWPFGNMVVVTNGGGCNPANERGVYLLQSLEFVPTGRQYRAKILETTWPAVATFVDFHYGTYTSPNKQVANFTSSCESVGTAQMPTSLFSTSASTSSSSIRTTSSSNSVKSG